ncbi:hypothetical protein QUB60_04905 [Microcoleus sp. A2-C5]
MLVAWLIASQLSDIMVATVVCIVEFEWDVRSVNTVVMWIILMCSEKI